MPVIRRSSDRPATAVRPTAILHIGLEKTGSTYLQELLFENAAALRERGLGYPTFLAGANHHALAAYALDATPPQDIHRWNGVDRTTQAAFRRELAEQLTTAVHTGPSLRWIFSSEHLSSRLVDDVSVRRCADLMTGAGLDARVVVFLRPQTEMIESSFSTYVAAGGTDPFDVDAEIARRQRYDYDLVLRRWEAAFGPDNISVHEYTAGSGSSELALRFLSLLGVDPEGLSLPAVRANTAMPFQQAELLRLLNEVLRQGEGLPRVRRRRLLEGLRAQHGPAFRLTEQEHRSVRDAFVASNDRVRERHGVDLNARMGAERRTSTARPDAFSRDEVSGFLAALLGSVSRRPRGAAPDDQVVDAGITAADT